MNCCMPVVQHTAEPDPENRTSEILLASRNVADGLRQTDVSVPGIHCGGCIQRIERALGTLPGVEHARVNLSTRRVSITWRSATAPPPLREALAELGYDGHLHDWSQDGEDRAHDRLVRAL